MKFSWKLTLGVLMIAVLVLVVLATQYKWMSQNDRNGDGNIDEWLRVNFKGEKIEFKRDKNYDTKIDYIERYENGNLKTIEVDFDYDGFFETKGYYAPENETLIRMERDSDNNGTVDRRTIYDEKTGLPLRVEIDSDEDGVFEKTLTDPKYAKQGETK